MLEINKKLNNYSIGLLRAFPITLPIGCILFSFIFQNKLLLYFAINFFITDFISHGLKITFKQLYKFNSLFRMCDYWLWVIFSQNTFDLFLRFIIRSVRPVNLFIGEIFQFRKKFFNKTSFWIKPFRLGNRIEYSEIRLGVATG